MQRAGELDVALEHAAVQNTSDLGRVWSGPRVRPDQSAAQLYWYLTLLIPKTTAVLHRRNLNGPDQPVLIV